MRILMVQHGALFSPKNTDSSTEFYARILSILCLVASVGCLLVIPVKSFSQTLAWSFENNVARSELIVVSEVIDIEYRDSQGGEDYLEAPHTFVTFKIEQIIQGAYSQDTLTLQMTGGYSPATGQVMITPRSPMFRIGNRDVLFIKGNGLTLCPFVGCSLGRFRVVDDKVFSDTGLAIHIRPNYQLSYGPGSLPDRMISMQVPPAPTSRLTELKQQLSKGTGLTEERRQRLKEMIDILSRPQTFSLKRVGQQPQAQQKPIASLDTFLKLVRNISKQNPHPKAQVKSVSPDAPIQIKTPSVARSTYTSRPTKNPALTLEQMRLERNHGNPVLEAVQ